VQCADTQQRDDESTHFRRDLTPAARKKQHQGALPPGSLTRSTPNAGENGFCFAVVYTYFSDFCVTNYFNIYRTDL